MSILRCLVAGAVLLTAGCAAPTAGPGPRASRPVVPGVVASPVGPGPAVSLAPAAKGRGWSQADIPVFPPAPVPERVVGPGEPGEVIYLKQVPTQQKVAFITIDDGYVKHAEAAGLLAAAHVPVTLFLTTDAVREDPDYFRPLIDAGAVVEAHTISHPELRGKSYAFQKHQICGSADQLATWYTRRPVLFRPPFGDKDETTLRAAHDCGMTAAFMWKETVNKGKVRYQEGHRVQPGDIILMHFRTSFVEDFLAALRAIRKAGLTPALLEDYVVTG
jgi:peptidoglycan/xylan/chitin deacetylase (PgdA/CDA1 family)